MMMIHTITLPVLTYGNTSFITLCDDKKHVYKNYFQDDLKEVPCIFEDEYAMYYYMNKCNCTFIPQYHSVDKYHRYLCIEYLENYVTLRTYISNGSFSYMNELFSLLENMEKNHFLHGNVSLDKIMIHPEKNIMKVIDLKYSKISSNKTNFLYEKYSIFYEIFIELYPKYKSYLLRYWKEKMPTYYTSQIRSCGEFYHLALYELFHEKEEDLSTCKNIEILNFVKDFMEYKKMILPFSPQSTIFE